MRIRSPLRPCRFVVPKIDNDCSDGGDALPSTAADAIRVMSNLTSGAYLTSNMMDAIEELSLLLLAAIVGCIKRQYKRF
ncbi:hypothetical protein DERP_009747 [Dermatophagoides pteronyssinus]|uniref:Uncharacterized protein n=1 Tax=Dermatophagoides pteronyssinus TaxID=6956 RepID=A0ABQ8IRF1_DERPT|nr:hypothetical protein DERP_009747 [Dermatophagoides pteronyssinus]